MEIYYSNLCSRSQKKTHAGSFRNISLILIMRYKRLRERNRIGILKKGWEKCDCNTYLPCSLLN
jgi:hypothetical protein